MCFYSELDTGDSPNVNRGIPLTVEVVEPQPLTA